MSVFDRYLEQAKDFTRKLVRTETGTRRWATVTSVDPILITYDGPAPQGIIPPVVLGTPVTIGDRVRAHTIGDRTYITRANPTPVTLDDLWVPGYPWRMAAGHVSVTASGGIGTAEVTFPLGRFTVTPLITATGNSLSGALENVQFANPSPTGFTAVLRRTNSTATGINWHAVQMTPTSAEG